MTYPETYYTPYNQYTPPQGYYQHPQQQIYSQTPPQVYSPQYQPQYQPSPYYSPQHFPTPPMNQYSPTQQYQNMYQSQNQLSSQNMNTPPINHQYNPSYHQNQLFVDHEFPACVESIGAIPRTDLIRKIRWLRPSEFMEDGKIQLVEDGIEPNDIIQGELGDSYFLASLAALAEYPTRIYRLISDKGNGRYEVKTYFQGIHRIVTVDDLIPCVDRKPVFSRNKGNELWVMIMEKAYAKLYGSYAALDGGIPYVSMNYITGMPARRIQLDDPKKNVDAFSLIQKYQKKDYNMNCFFVGEVIPHFSSLCGLQSSHAYTILEAIEYRPEFDDDEVFRQRFKDVKSVKLIKLRDPWGQNEWRGPWNEEDDSRWTPKMKKLLDVKVANDGIFYMEIEHFKLFFTTIDILYFKEYCPYFHGVELTLTAKQIQIPFSAQDDFTVSIVQPDEKKQVGLIMWVVDQYEQPIGGESGLPYQEKTLIKGRKVHLERPTYGKIIIDVFPEDAQKALPQKINLSIRSKYQINLGQLLNSIEGDEIGYSTLEYKLGAKLCKICGYPLTITKTTNVSNIGECHNRCLRCNGCRKPIVDKFQVRGNLIYCQNC